ncbi:P-type conjugative transfer protein VirB9 [Legionella erythra]|uniref:Vir protein n=1 Tax=Legionella erythra TaxID=448 RepID=A0A0W0TRV0_LEGER|nr:P-type conjugative transfer protein VirB9 [Legionella erythra]KTC98216.1 hypothetical protein Lery_1270 [Legionella erythra]HEM0351352.1 P-type conjugative transfer protein VirB9 [Legionella pneumophila]
MKYPLIALLMLTACMAKAQQIPASFASDARVKHVPFHEHNVVKVEAAPFTATQILFNPKEVILDIEGGDTAGWMVTHHRQLGNTLFIKPTALNSNTNLTVITTKRTYYFQVVSATQLDAPAQQKTYAVVFTYPEEEEAKRKALQQAKAKIRAVKAAPKKVYNWNYRFSGNAQVTPQHVYDDGHFTYFELRANQPVPAIFAVEGRDGRESIVNTRRQGNVLVVQRLAPQFTLRNGGLVASVFNTLEIAKIKQGRR